jgi:hypothetical protein
VVELKRQGNGVLSKALITGAGTVVAALIIGLGTAAITVWTQMSALRADLDSVLSDIDRRREAVGMIKDMREDVDALQRTVDRRAEWFERLYRAFEQIDRHNVLVQEHEHRLDALEVALARSSKPSFESWRKDQN